MTYKPFDPLNEYPRYDRTFMDPCICGNTPWVCTSFEDEEFSIHYVKCLYSCGGCGNKTLPYLLISNAVVNWNRYGWKGNK